MAKHTTKPSTKRKRQPAKKRLPSSSAKKVSRTRKLTVNLRVTRKTNLAIAIKLSRSRATKTKTRHKTKGRQPSKQATGALSNKRRTILTVAIILVCFVGAVYFGLQTFVSAQPKTITAPSQSQQIKPPKPAPKKYLSRSEAVSLQIPSIGLDAQVEKIGQNADGTLEVPANYLVAGWYHLGPAPGEIGPAVIAGHVDNIRGPGVFFRLREIQLGQIIYVRRADGKTAQFKVTAVQNFAQDSFPTDEVYSNINHAGLRLITCGGSFNPLIQRYSHNTVVFASFLE